MSRGERKILSTFTQTFTQTDHPHRMKVFASLFSKSDWGSGQRPAIRCFWFFLQLLAQKERRGGSHIMLQRISSHEFGCAPFPSHYPHPLPLPLRGIPLAVPRGGLVLVGA